MISSWWYGLTQREQLMLGVLGVVLAITVFFFAVLQPMQAANKSAKSVFDRRSEDSVAFQQALTRYQLSSTTANTAPAADADSFRADIAPLAGDYGLSVSRLQPTGDGRLLVTFDDAIPEDLFAFLVDVQELPGGQVVAASVNSRGGDVVNAVIEFRGAGQ